MLKIFSIAIIAGLGGLAGLGFLIYRLFIVNPVTSTPDLLPAPLPVAEPIPMPTPATISAPPDSKSGSSEHIIRIDSSGRYHPTDLSIRVGDTVTFVNDDTKLHWPGANPHPTHSSLPAFSAFEGMSTGERYSFLFEHSGTYGYHDHVRDSSTVGVITVIER